LATTRAYLICTTPRSGSTLLCRYLTATGCAGVPDEYLFEKTLPRFYGKHGVGDFPSYFRALLENEATPNGVFGLKLMGAPDVFAGYLARLRELPGLAQPELAPWQLVEAALPGVRYVWLTRRHKIRQAISLHRALRFGVWQSTEPGAARRQTSELELAGIDECLSDLIAWDGAWEEYFAAAGVRPLTLVYEDVVRDPAAAVHAVLGHLEVPAPPDWKPGVPERARLADDATARWEEIYRRTIKGERAGARRRAAAVESREYVRIADAPARELAARVPAWRLVKALAWPLLDRFSPRRRQDPAAQDDV
jgi:LPS sulfotransferase NodH